MKAELPKKEHSNILKGKDHLNFRSIVNIQVVVHIVWHHPSENISDELIISQINRLNEDFNAENKDLENVPPEFEPLIGNCGIRFCIASISPDNQATTGITRTYTQQENIGLSNKLFDSSQNGVDAWNPDKYLNIWVANTGETIAGFGTYPEFETQKISGVVIHPKYFGQNGHARFGLGRIATHEVGHYLGLRHAWAEGAIQNVAVS